MSLILGINLDKKRGAQGGRAPAKKQTRGHLSSLQRNEDK